MVRGVLIGIGVYIIAIFFTTATILHFWQFLYFLFAASLLFSALGAIVGLWGKTFDHINLPNTFILLPLTFFGGVFHSVSMLPPAFARLSYLNPIFYMVNGIRGSMIGVSDVSSLTAGTVIAVLTLISVIWSVRLFKSGYHLRS